MICKQFWRISDKVIVLVFAQNFGSIFLCGNFLKKKKKSALTEI